MKRAFMMATAGLAVALAALTSSYMAGPISANAEDAAPVAASTETLDRKAVETIVREYLMANPEILVEVQNALEVKQKEAQRVAQLDIIKDAKDEIFNSSFDSVVGNPNGKVTLVEFYDYNCGYCKHALSDMQALIKEDPELRFVLKEFPILGPDSQKAHVVSMAFHKLMPEKYAEFHDQLLGGKGRAGEATAMKIAVSLGADEAKLREAMKDPSIGEVFSRTYELANKLSITGTPSYVVGNEVVFGALGKEVLAEKIAAAKACAETAC